MIPGNSDAATTARRRGRPVLRHLTVAEAAGVLDWDADALQRLLTHTDGLVLPGASREDDGTWSVPESALRRITGAGLLLFSIPTLAKLIDADAGHLRRLARTGKLRVVKIADIGQRVPFAEYQRLLAGAGAQRKRSAKEVKHS